MSADLVAYYRALLQENYDLSHALCWSVVRGISGPVTVENVVRRMGGDLSTLRERPLSAAYEDYDPNAPIVHLAQPGPSVAVAEFNGYQATAHAMARSLSADASLHTIYWHVNGHDQLGYWVRGRMLAGTDLHHVRWSGDAPDTLAPELEPLLAATDFPRTAGLAAIELRTGVRLDGSWSEQPQLSFVIPSPSAVNPPEPPPDEGDPDLAAWFAFAGTIRQRGLRALVVRLLAQHLGLSDDGSLSYCVSALRQGEPADAMRSDLDHAVARVRPLSEPTALAIACVVDDPDNFETAIVHARSAFAEFWPDARAAVVDLARRSS